MKKFIFVLLLAVLVVSGCGSKTSSVQQPKSEKLSGSIDDLMAKGKDIKCNLVAKEGESIVSGTTFISGTRARTDYKNKVDDKTAVSTHMINDGTWLYSWTDENPEMAIKMKLETLASDALKSGTAQTQADEAGLDNYQEKFDYDCYAWLKDEALFSVPADVNFVDYTTLMENAQKTLNNLNSGNNPAMQNVDTKTMCATCDNISDASSKSMCRQQLGCK
ncbi:MAG: hypothetical protein NTZ49_05735 [Candidatus Parcubacteria bacterium]|nr:hypothetical protein [Candidatus Parcubacteria bacterium]